MKRAKKALSLLLTLCMLSGISVNTFATDANGEAVLNNEVSESTSETEQSTENDEFYKIVHLDAGRKYFSPENIKAIIDVAEKAGYNQVELYLSDNQGFRFALEDMTVTTSANQTYDLTPALGDGYSDGSKYPDGSGKYLTQAEMTEIISYAKEKGIDIVPCINTPGHMGAILEEFSDFCYTGSKSSINLENAEAVAFALGIVDKYAAYFAAQGVKFFNLGADEYANDLSTMGFEGLYNSGKYQKFVAYLNQAAQLVIDRGMTPRAFNDGIYYESDTSVSINKEIQVCYWSSGWGGYDVASAQTIAKQGHDLINTHGDYYWVLGNSSWQCSADKASQFEYTSFQGGTISDPAGAMFCIWCDVGNADGTDEGAKIVSATADAITAFGATLPQKKTEEIVETEKVTVTCDGGNVSITAPGLTSLTCSSATEPAIEGANNILAYDMVPMVGEEAYTGEATVAVKVPDGWNTADMGAFVVEADGIVTKLTGGYVDGVYTYVVPHLSISGIYDATQANNEVTNYKTITVTVGQTATATIDGADYSADVDETELDKNIATVEVSGEQIAGSTVITEVTSITNGESYYIKNSSGKYLACSNGAVSWVDDASNAVKWTVSGSGSNYYLYYGDNYLRYNNNKWMITTEKWYGTGLSYSNGTFSYRSYYSDGNTVILGTSCTETTTEAKNQTTVNFTGITVGTTYVTVGNTRYTINVLAEDLSKATPLTVEYWITNRPVTANSATSGTITASAAGVHDKAGAKISDLVPAEGIQESNEVVFWKATRLASNNKQTIDSGVDKTASGTDLEYIRYWDGVWSYSADRTTWTNVISGDQIVAYYLQKTDVTDEVETQVVDWGVDWSTYSDSNYVLLDYAVKYESGERVPDSFPVSGKTLGFHCNYASSSDLGNTVIKDGNTYYRKIGMIRAEETMDYEVYMITLTPTSDTKTTQLASSAKNNSRYNYNGTEKVVWVDDIENLGEFTDTSKQHEDFAVGGEAIVPSLKIYNRQGMLVTYYVRAKVTEDSLSVHYIDRTTGQEFYNYNIAVAEGTLFDVNIGLPNPWKGDLANGTVVNILNKNQTVSSDLSTMPAIGAQYRYSDYTCEQVTRSQNGKDVYLYYTFNNAHEFVVDFGLPLSITAADLNISGNWTSAAVSGAKYGTATVSVGGGMVYTPNKVLLGVETLQLTLTDATGSTTHRIYIYPATTVYYEEGFAALEGFSDGSKGTVNQKTEAVGNKANVYGYDSAYNIVGASNSTQATSTTYGDKATFTFTGTGLGIYANCATDTGRLFIQLKSETTQKLVQVKTALLVGTTDVTAGQAVTGYNVPVVAFEDLPYDTYTVIITHMKSSADAAGDTVNLDGFRVYGTLAYSSEVYQRDGEANPTFIELRDKVLAALNVNDTASQYAKQIAADTMAQVYSTAGGTNGAVVIDAANSDVVTSGDSAQDLLDNGPKNELYLRPKQSVVFNLGANVVRAQIGLKALNAAVNYTIAYGNAIEEPVNLASSTDMFYELKTEAGAITINNNSGGILSVTELKLFASETESTIEFEALTEAVFMPALLSLGYEEEPAEPEVTYADAVLTIAVNTTEGNELATTELTANGIEGETTVFGAADIRSTVEAMELPEGYTLVDVNYSDVEVAYGEKGTVTFTATLEEAEEPEPEPTPEEKPDEVEAVIGKFVDIIKNLFHKFWWR